MEIWIKESPYATEQERQRTSGAGAGAGAVAVAKNPPLEVPEVPAWKLFPTVEPDIMSRPVDAAGQLRAEPSQPPHHLTSEVVPYSTAPRFPLLLLQP